LVAAWELGRSTNAEIDLYEASDRLGGKISTTKTAGLIIEEGPDCFFTRKAGVMELVRELGLEIELIDPLRSEFAMLVGGTLHAVPRGLVALGNVDPVCVEQTGFLSAEAKRRVRNPYAEDAQSPSEGFEKQRLTPEHAQASPNARETANNLSESKNSQDQATPTKSPLPFPGRGSGEGSGDTSIRSFFSAKYGPEFSRLVAEPLLAGTHGGDPAQLSMKALYPGYLSSSTPPATGVGPTFRSFRAGMGTLPKALECAIQGRINVHLNASIENLDQIEADHILLAVPAPVAARLLEPKSKDLTDRLRQIPHRSTTIVTFAFKREDIKAELPFTGFLVPEGEHPYLTGSTWSSEKWEGRAPEDTILLRVFVKEGTSAGEALAAIRPLLAIQNEPVFQHVTNWRNAQPQYDLGHLDRVEAIETMVADLDGITLAGTSYRGVGIPDCIRQGREAAAAIVNKLGKPQ